MSTWKTVRLPFCISHQQRLSVLLSHTLIDSNIFSGREAPGKVFSHTVAHEPLPGVLVAINQHGLMNCPQQRFSRVFLEFKPGTLLRSRVPGIDRVIQPTRGANNWHGSVL